MPSRCGIRGRSTRTLGHVTPDRDVVRSPAFLLTAAGATLTTLAMFAALVALIPLLVGRGMTPTLAAWALGLGGAGQVLGRLAFPRLTAITDVGHGCCGAPPRWR